MIVHKDTVTGMLQPVKVAETTHVGQVSCSNNENSNTLPSHLTELYEKSAKNLSFKQKNDLKLFLIKHQSIFSKDSGDIGLNTWVKHKIDTGDAKPVKKYPYRIPLAKGKSC